MSDEAKFELSLDAKAHASCGQWDRASREITRAIHAERGKVWEEAAREVENGRFLTNESPEYNFGQKVAMMLRRKAQEEL